MLTSPVITLQTVWSLLLIPQRHVPAVAEASLIVVNIWCGGAADLDQRHSKREAGFFLRGLDGERPCMGYGNLVGWHEREVPSVNYGLRKHSP
jgi:hypothetical protein